MKKFTSNLIRDVFYEVIDEGWLDNETYIMAFQEMTDGDGDTYHLEVEYHSDEERIVYTRVYDYDTLSGEEYVSSCFRKQMEEYILRKVGVLDDNNLLFNRTISVDLKLGIPKDMSVGEFEGWLKKLELSVSMPIDSKIDVLEVNVKK